MVKKKKRGGIKNSYAILPDNRLVIRQGDITGYRRVLDGRFTTDEGNNLIYGLRMPSLRESGENIPRLVKLAGTWSLDANHDLELKLRADKEKKDREAIILTGEIVSAERNALVFGLSTESAGGKRSSYLLNLKGRWQADENNRLIFRVKKSRGIEDVLVFDGVWDVGRNNQIVYRYRKFCGGGKKNEEKDISFRGYWEVPENGRLAFWLNAGKTSGFNFRAQVNPIRGNGRKVGFTAAIKISGRKNPVRKTVLLSGKWKFPGKAELVFELEPAARGKKKLLIGALHHVGEDGSVEFTLSNRRRKGLAAGVMFRKKFFAGQADTYLKLRKEAEKSAVEAGIVGRF